MNMVIAQVSSMNENNTVQSMEISVPMIDWSRFMLEENGYVAKTTFWDDFSIADKFGLWAVQDTFNRAFREWKDNYVYLTELVLVLNHKIWFWYKRNEELARLYDTIHKQADCYACNNLKGEERSYFYRTTD